MPRQKRSAEQLQLAKDVGRRLMSIRDMVELSREEFVRRLGHGSQRVLANYENGEVLIPTDLAKRVCEEFDVTFSWLMSGTGPRRQTDIRLQVESRRVEEEALETLKAIQYLVEKHGYEDTVSEESSLRGQFNQALRICLSRLERRFQPMKGARQFSEFFEDLILTLMELWGPAGDIPKAVLIKESARLRRVEETRRKRISREIDTLYNHAKGAKEEED